MILNHKHIKGNNMTNAIDNMELSDNATLRNEVIVTLEGKDINIPMDSLQVSIDSSSNDILNAVKDIIQESEGNTEGYEDAYGNYTYTVRKALNSNTIYVYPKPVAG
jgi:hypothetical protein